jgi:type III restriction enzyme
MASEEHTLNTESMMPLYAAWEEPVSHRTRANKPGGAAPVLPRRRPSQKPIVNTLRGLVREWREQGYPGASNTTQVLLNFWFGRVHRIRSADGAEFDFRYYFCQQEAVETLVFLKEVRRRDRVSQLLDEFGSDAERATALGVRDEDDAWARAAFKMATGSGKTKAMALCIAWSYFHALFETDSPMARHFVVIAPGLTVYERLKQDFVAAKDNPDIFECDPIIPPEWRGDWNLSVVEQDQAGGAATGGVLYLTNIHRLYDVSKRRGRKDGEYQDFMGPSVAKASALDTGEELRSRIASHGRIMVCNDEAHHVWDPGSAWNEAIRALHDGCMRHNGVGIVHQLDFSATPKDDQGNLFRHVIVDTPLGEAVDGGIVKFPIIGKADKLRPSTHTNAGYKYDLHLRLGYERWKKSYAEWQGIGKKALLFVMCENTEAADEITARLNDDPDVFPELQGRTINLHTNLKGRVVIKGTGQNRQAVFEEKESQISDEDLAELRKLSRDLDSGDSPYLCIVSVLMLREGWDVRNVTTIVPLRPFSADSGILAEQTLGRGLRRITGPGAPDGVLETVTVIDHPKFAELYKEELEQEGVIPEVAGSKDIDKTTVDIFVDTKRDLDALAIEIPQLSAGYSRKPLVAPITLEDARQGFRSLEKLPLDSNTDRIMDFEGRALTTGEVVQKLKLELPTLAVNAMAVSFYVQLIEKECAVTGLFGKIGGVIEQFIEQVLFEEQVSLHDTRLSSRLGDPDVATHVLHVFVPLIRARTTNEHVRAAELPPMPLQEWKPFKATHSDRNPCRTANKTMFNLVPCRGGLEASLVPFLDLTDNGVAAFAKNAGPQSLRIDYVKVNGQMSTYAPDFFVRGNDGAMFVVETKGREDADVPRKARAAVAWCEAASTETTKWSYVFVPQNAVEAMGPGSFDDLRRACAPALDALLHHEDLRQSSPLFAMAMEQDRAPNLPEYVDRSVIERLSERARRAAEQAVLTLEFLRKREDADLAPAFTSLLGEIDSAARDIIVERLLPSVPGISSDQRIWFDPRLDGNAAKTAEHYKKMAANLRKTLVTSSGLMPIGLLRDCMDYALQDRARHGGVFESVRGRFKFSGGRKLLSAVSNMYDFRNTYVAHHDQTLTDQKLATRALGDWLALLAQLSNLDPDAIETPSV